MSNTGMVVRQRKSLEAWITEALIDQVDEKPCSQLSLAHVQASSAEIEIYTKPTHPGMNPAEVASLMQGKAEAYAQDLAGEQTFLLIAMYGQKRRQFPYAVKGSYGFDAASLNSYSPDERGQKQLAMNGLQAMMGLFLGKTSMLFEATDRLIDRMTAREQTLMRENTDAWVIMKEMWMKEITQQHDLRMREMQFQRDNDMMKAFWRIAPAVMNQLTGAEIVPQNTADTAIIETLARELLKKSDKERMGVIASFQQLGIPPVMMGMLASRLEQLTEQFKTEDENAKRAFNGTGGNVDLELGPAKH